MSFDAFTLLPADEGPTPDQDLEQAAAGALAIPEDVAPAADDPPAPFGMTWRFDYEHGRFIRAGSSPAKTSGFGAVQEWCLMALHTTRFASKVVSDEFGMEDPDEPLGEFAIGEVLADWQRNLREALLVHDRITSVENIDLTWDPAGGVLYVNNFDVVTDEEERFSVSGVSVKRSDT